MTQTQYILNWSAYVFGVFGISCAFYLVMSSWSLRLKRALCISCFVVLITPWWSADSTPSYLSPALLTAIYDGLSHGIHMIPRAGTICVFVFLASFFIAILLPVRKKREQSISTKKRSKDKASNKRQEPSC